MTLEQAQVADMELSDAICEVRVNPSVLSCCGVDTESPEAGSSYQSRCVSNYCTPAPMLVWETSHASLLGNGGGVHDSSPHRGLVLLPGAWAMGEGMLMDLGEQHERATPFRSAGSADAIQRNISRVADSFTATMGSYLLSLASAITGCSRAANTDDDGFPSPASETSSPPGRRPLLDQQRCSRALFAGQPPSKKDD